MVLSVLVRVTLASDREAGIIRRSIIDHAPGSRSQVDLSTTGPDLVLRISASDIAALRAATNSCLRQVKIANDAIL